MNRPGMAGLRPAEEEKLPAAMRTITLLPASGRLTRS